MENKKSYDTELKTSEASRGTALPDDTLSGVTGGVDIITVDYIDGVQVDPETFLPLPNDPVPAPVVSGNQVKDK